MTASPAPRPGTAIMPEGQVTACGSCGSPDLRPVLDLGDQPLPQARCGGGGGRYPLRLVECGQCTLVQLDYIAPQGEVFPAGYPYATGNTRALREHFASLARDVAAMTSPGDLVIDIGGNDGTMLAALRREAPGARLLLVEPTDQARKCADATVVQDYFTAELAGKIRQDHGQAAVITASSVFGHVPDPHDFLDGAVKLLAPGGTLVIENQDWLSVVNGLQVDTVYHEHLRYYSPASLSRLLAMHSLLVIRLTRIAMHGGSFRAVVQRQEPDLQGRAGRLRTALREMVRAAAEDGPVYAIGAPTRATTLVNWAGIAQYLACACEIAGSEKIGACIPGTSVPVVDEAKLIADRPPHALLLAWDLEDTIVPALRRKGYQGTILIPLPEPGVSGA